MRHPPACTSLKPQPFKVICQHLKAPGKPRPERTTVYQAVKNFHREVGTRGRKLGYRKTTPEEDKAILSAFFRIRQPCGSEVVYKDVWCGLSDHLRTRICVKTVKNRLAEHGYHLEDKLTVDDRGRGWRKLRVAFCTSHKDKTQEQWASTLRGPARRVTSCPSRTINSCSSLQHHSTAQHSTARLAKHSTA